LAEVEEAERTIRSSMELRGEEPPVAELERAADLAARTVLDEASRDPAIVRFRSWFDFAMANFWLVLGAATRAIARLEQAATRRPGWAAPLAALALHHARHDRSAQALGAFRRALDADRRWVERQTFVVRPLARAFLRRAEEVERAGRLDIARGLVDEALALDLRRVQTELRFELGRRQERLRVRGEP
jgi:tetratricopeptide (TPR) repeat protein